MLYLKLQIGESFEECAIREAKEETNLDLENLKFFHVTNNRNMDNDPQKHYITIFMKVRQLENHISHECHNYFEDVSIFSHI